MLHFSEALCALTLTHSHSPYQAGGYTVGEFAKFGGPLLLLSALVTCSCASLFVWDSTNVAALFDDDTGEV